MQSVIIFQFVSHRKLTLKTPKHEHITTSYQCFKTFDETSFLADLNYDLYNLEINRKDIDEDFMKLHVRISKHLDKHAPIQLHRVKSNHLPDWYIPEIGQSRIARDKCKHLRKWADYKRRRNRTRYLICKVKCSHFTNSIENLKVTNTMWKHLRSNNGPDSSDYTLLEELVVDGEQLTDFQTTAVKLNVHFTSTARKLGPKITKLATKSLSPRIADLMNKSIFFRTFTSQLKCANIAPSYKGGSKSDPSNYRPISILPTISKIFEKHVNMHLMNF